MECKQKDLDELESVARVVVDMVDPPTDGVAFRTLLEHLRSASNSISGYISGTTKTVVAHVLGLVQPFYRDTDMELLAEGIAEDCSMEKFSDYLQEVNVTP